MIYSGIGYDEWMESCSARGENRIASSIIVVADLIGAKDGDNPHIWYDAENDAGAGGQTGGGAFRVSSPGRADAYRKNAGKLQGVHEARLDKIAAIKAASAGLEVTATEPVFGYMAGALGFKMLNYDFQIKIMNDAEPSADETAAFEKSLTGHDGENSFLQQPGDRSDHGSRMQHIARQAGVPVVGVTETQPPDQKNYVDWMRHELDGVRAALPAKSR